MQYSDTLDITWNCVWKYYWNTLYKIACAYWQALCLPPWLSLFCKTNTKCFSVCRILWFKPFWVLLDFRKARKYSCFSKVLQHPGGFASQNHLVLKKYLWMVFRVWIFWSKHAWCVFSFSKVEQHPKCLDQGIQTQKTIRYFFYKITTVVI